MLKENEQPSGGTAPKDESDIAAHIVQPLHNPLPEPVRVRRGRMEFRTGLGEDEFDLDVTDSDEFDV